MSTQKIKQNLLFVKKLLAKLSCSHDKVIRFPGRMLTYLPDCLTHTAKNEYILQYHTLTRLIEAINETNPIMEDHRIIRNRMFLFSERRKVQYI